MSARPQGQRFLPGSFPTTRLTLNAHDLLSDFRAACVALGEATTKEQVEAAYSHVSVTQQSLTGYLSWIERSAGFSHQAIHLRF